MTNVNKIKLLSVLNPWDGCLGQSLKEANLLMPSLNYHFKLLQPVYDTYGLEMLNINQHFLEMFIKHNIFRLCYIFSNVKAFFKESHVFSL